MTTIQEEVDKVKKVIEELEADMLIDIVENLIDEEC